MSDHLRRLLHLDLQALGWRGALAQLASQVCQAFAPGRVLLALRSAVRWEAVTAAGTWIDEQEIRTLASLSILAAVRDSGEPLLAAAGTPLGLRSRSIEQHLIRQVLCVPLRWWEAGAAHERRSFGGALYIDRREGEAAFGAEDARLALDFAALAEHLLSLLRSLHGESQRPPAPAEFALGGLRSCEPEFIAGVLQPLAQAARVERVGVLLLGATGSGKSHLARAYHEASLRRDRPFVVFDCGQTASEETLAAELFGYAPRSGFSAPTEGRAGKAQAADGGTLFIDEVGALPPPLQAKLLRLLQEGRYTPLGSASEQQVDLQIVAATNAALPQLVEQGHFRADLYWRLAELTLELPHLDERPADIPGLAATFLDEIGRRARRTQVLRLHPDALRALQAAPWRRLGNLRGLQALLTRSVLRLDPTRGEILAADLALPAADARLEAAADVSGAPSLRALCASKLVQYQGNLRRMCGDEQLARRIDGGVPPLAYTSLRLLLRRLGLETEVQQARQSRLPGIDAIRAAIERHGTVAAAAEALAITRDMLQWQLRRAGLSARQLRARRSAPSL